MISEKMNFTENHLVGIFMVSFKTPSVGMTELTVIPYIIIKKKVTYIFSKQVTE